MHYIRSGLAGITALLFLAIGTTAYAQETPTSLVEAFYKDYMQANSEGRRFDRTAFINRHKPRMSAELYDLLGDISDNGQADGAWLDFDPFINAQMNAATFSVRAPEKKGELSYVPVYVSLRAPGHESLRAHVVVGSVKGKLQIENFVYPARDEQASWDLLSWLHKSLKR